MMMMSETAKMNEASMESCCHDVAKRIHNGRRFLITSHRNPDGDALGSALALQKLIRNLGKEARVLVRDRWSKSLDHLPGVEQVEITDSLPADYPEAYDALFTMECPEPERAGFPILPGPVVNIDHHLGNTMYGEINYLDLAAPSVGEMVLQLAREMGVEVDRDMAVSMYVSLATDTGFFRYTNTTLRAFDAAGELVRAGADPGAVSLWINESASLGSIRLLGLCLNTLTLESEGRIALMEMPKSFLAQAGASPEDSDGIVSIGRTIDGVLVSALLKEADGVTRVSMRAKPGVDVQAVAAMFGGGGHKAAAGCAIPLPLSEAREKLTGILKEIV